MADDPIAAEHIGKRFGPTVALRDINIHLRKGEVLGLLGDNGAGKSTLIKILCGFQKQDAGTMWCNGEAYAPKSVDDARKHGVDTVFQDLALINELSVYHNLFLRREKVKTPIPFLNNALMRRDARKALDEIGITIVLQVILSLSRWGIYTVSVGGNRLGAAEAGVATRRVLTGNFVMCALLAGFVGILEAVRSSSVTPDPSGSNAILFQVIAAAVIGGTLLQGGSGTVIGAFIGAIFLGVLQDGLIIKGVSANYFLFYLGLAVLIAMAFNTYVSRVRTGSGRA